MRLQNPFTLSHVPSNPTTNQYWFNQILKTHKTIDRVWQKHPKNCHYQTWSNPLLGWRERWKKENASTENKRKKEKKRELVNALIKSIVISSFIKRTKKGKKKKKYTFPHFLETKQSMQREVERTWREGKRVRYGEQRECPPPSPSCLGFELT